MFLAIKAKNSCWLSRDLYISLKFEGEYMKKLVLFVLILVAGEKVYAGNDILSHRKLMKLAVKQFRPYLEVRNFDTFKILKPSNCKKQYGNRVHYVSNVDLAGEQALFVGIRHHFNENRLKIEVKGQMLEIGTLSESVGIMMRSECDSSYYHSYIGERPSVAKLDAGIKLVTSEKNIKLKCILNSDGGFTGIVIPTLKFRYVDESTGTIATFKMRGRPIGKCNNLKTIGSGVLEEVTAPFVYPF